MEGFRDGEFHPFGGEIMHPRRRLHWNERERERSPPVMLWCFWGDAMAFWRRDLERKKNCL
jgi:hypothetical protein